MKPFWCSLFIVSSLLIASCNPVEGDAPAEPYQEIRGSDRASPSIARLHVRDFGALPSSANNFQALEKVVAAAKAADGPVEILFEPGAVYRVGLPDGEKLQSQYAWHIKDATNLVINGQGATLLVTHPEPGAICTEDSSHVEVKNFRIDYDPLPYALGTIVKINPTEYWFELKVDEGFMEPDKPCFNRAMSKWGLTVKDEPDGGRRYGPTAVFSDHWKKTGDRIWRFYPPQNGGGYSNPLAALAVGDRFIHMARNYAQAVAAKNCDDLLWENITILSSPGLAFYPRGTSHHTIRGCHVKVKDGRIFSTNADGIHMRGSRGHVLIDGCSFEGMADDAINVHSSAMSVQGQPAPNQVLVKKHTFSVRPGDRLQLVHTATSTRGETVIVKKVEDRGGNWLLTLDRDLPPMASGSGFATSDNFYNLSESADPFVIRNCRFNDYRGRGILVSAHGGLIEDNVFNIRQGWSVVLNYESTRWAEGPIAYDLVVRDNEFHGHGEYSAAILSHLLTRKGTKSESRPFHNIRIEGNTFYEYGTPAVELHAARDVQILDNRVVCSDSAKRGRETYAAVELHNCEEITVDGLEVQDRDARQVAIVKIGEDCAPSITINNLKTNVAATCQPILDKRK